MEEEQIFCICCKAISMSSREEDKKRGLSSSGSPAVNHLEEFFHLFLQNEAFEINLGGQGFGTNCCGGCADILNSVLNGMNRMEGLQMEVLKIENTLQQKLGELKKTGERVKFGIEQIQKSITNDRKKSSLDLNQNEIYLRKGTVKASNVIKGELAEIERKLICLTSLADEKKETSSPPGQIVSVASVDTNFSNDEVEESEAMWVKTENDEDPPTEAVPVLESAIKVEEEAVRTTRQRTVYRKQSFPLPVEFLSQLTEHSMESQQIDFESEEDIDEYVEDYKCSEMLVEELPAKRVAISEPQSSKFNTEIYQAMCNYCWENAPVNETFLSEPQIWQNFIEELEKMEDVERRENFLVKGNRAVYRKCLKYLKGEERHADTVLIKQEGGPDAKCWTAEFATSPKPGAMQIRKFMRSNEVSSVSVMVARLTKQVRLITPGVFRAHAWVEVISTDPVSGKYCMTIKDGTTLAPMERTMDLKVKAKLGIRNPALIIGPNQVDKQHNNCFASSFVAIVNHLMGCSL